MAAHDLREHVLAHGGDGFGYVTVVNQFIALCVNHTALVVGDVVVFEQLLADVEVARFDFALRRFDGARHHARFDGFTVRNLEAIHDGFEALTCENPQQRVVHRQIKTRRSGIALTTCATAQLIVNAT